MIYIVNHNYLIDKSQIYFQLNDSSCIAEFQNDFSSTFQNINQVNNITIAKIIKLIIQFVKNGLVTSLQQWMHTFASDLISSAQLGHFLIHI
jgi:hypothetical protein